MSSEIAELANASYEKYLLKYGEKTEGFPSTPTPEHLADYQNVDLDSFEFRQVRRFGAENLCWQIMDKLELRKIDKRLYERITDMFELEDRLVIFDLRNIYQGTTPDCTTLE